MQPGSLALDGDALFVGDYGTGPSDGRIWRVDIDGGPAVALASGQATPWGIALDSSYVYWTNSGQGEPDAGSVVRVPRGGGQVELLADRLSSPVGIAIHGGRVYWLTFGTGPQNGALWVRPLDGGSTVQLLDGLAGAQGLAIDGHRAFWTEAYAGTVSSMPLDGGAVRVVGDGGSTLVTTDSTYVYWSNNLRNTIHRAPGAGGPAQVLAQLQLQPGALVVDGEHVYVPLPNGMWRVPLDGGVAAAVPNAGPETAGSVQVDARWVYWSSGGTVYRIAK